MGGTPRICVHLGAQSLFSFGKLSRTHIAPSRPSGTLLVSFLPRRRTSLTSVSCGRRLLGYWLLHCSIPEEERSICPCTGRRKLGLGWGLDDLLEGLVNLTDKTHKAGLFPQRSSISALLLLRWAGGRNDKSKPKEHAKPVHQSARKHGSIQALHEVCADPD